MPSSTPIGAETFASVLTAVLGATGMTAKTLAARLGLSPKTITRYTCGYGEPPLRARHGIVYALRDIDPGLLTRLVASLGLTHEFISGAPAPAPDAAVAKHVTEAALVELLDRLDVGHVSGRQAVTRFLARLADARIDATTARNALAK
jgi:transcriptional regulator with XRE-family HTH domain